MDPDANLQEQRELTHKLIEALAHTTPVDEVDVARLCELVQDLDNWIKRGGFLPAAWQPKEKK